MIDWKLVAGDIFVVLGAMSVMYGYQQDDLAKVSWGMMACIAGIGLLYSSVSKKLSGKHKTYLISNGIYAGLGIFFAMVSIGTDEQLIIRTMSASILVVAAIALNIANFDDNL